MNLTTAPDLRNLTDEALYDAFTASTDDAEVVAMVREMDRRERAEIKAARERARRAAIRAEWELYQHADYLAADAICRGNLLSKAGKAAGVSEQSLWTGREEVARKYASDELNEHWDANPRLTATQYAERRAAEARQAKAEAAEQAEEVTTAEATEAEVAEVITEAEAITEAAATTERNALMSTTKTATPAAAPMWTDMDADAFGADSAGVLFDASTLTRNADACGTPDMFTAEADPDVPEVPALMEDSSTEAEQPEPADLPAGTRVRVARRGGATGTVQAKDPVGAWFDRAYNTRPTVSIKFDGAGHGLNYPEDVEVLDEPVGSVPVWVRTCSHVGCILTAPHKHGQR